MQVRRTVGVLAAAVAVVVSMVGCSKSASSSGDPAAFTDKICASFLPFLETASKPPALSPNDPIKASNSFSDYLGNAIASLDKATAGLDGVGKSPVAGGDELVAKTKTAVTQFRTAFVNAKAGLDTAPDTKTAKAAAMSKAVSAISALSNAPDLTQDLKDNADLNAAYEKSANCQKLKTLGK